MVAAVKTLWNLRVQHGDDLNFQLDSYSLLSWIIIISERVLEICHSLVKKQAGIDRLFAFSCNRRILKEARARGHIESQGIQDSE